MAKTLASQAKNGGSIPLARSSPALPYPSPPLSDALVALRPWRPEDVEAGVVLFAPPPAARGAGRARGHGGGRPRRGARRRGPLRPGPRARPRVRRLLARRPRAGTRRRPARRAAAGGPGP